VKKTLKGKSGTRTSSQKKKKECEQKKRGQLGTEDPAESKNREKKERQYLKGKGDTSAKRKETRKMTTPG